MLSYKKCVQHLNYQRNPLFSQKPKSLFFLNINRAISSWDPQCYQNISARRSHSLSKNQFYPLELVVDIKPNINQSHCIQIKRRYSSYKKTPIENGFSNHLLSMSPTSYRTFASASPLSAVSTVVPSVAAENQAHLHQHATTAANAANDVASTSDLYGWLSGYIHFLESVAASAPVMQMMSMLRLAHESTGLPWWLTIVLTTVIVRTTITLPLAFYQQYVVARLELLRGEMVEHMKVLAAETRRAKQEHNWDEETAKIFFKRQSRDTWRSLVVRDNCHPGKGVVLVLAQLPLWVLLSISHRNLALCRPVPDAVALTAYSQLSVEGLLWCPNLTATDPMLLLPIAMGLVNLIITEVNVLQRPEATSRGMKGLTNFLRGVSVITVPIAMIMPSGVVLYWVTSSFCALTQTLLLLHPGLRKAVGIPVTPSTHPHPYSRLVNTLYERLSRQRGPGQLPIKTPTDELNHSDDKAPKRLKKQR